MPIIEASMEMFVVVPVSRPHHVPSHSTTSFFGRLGGVVKLAVPFVDSGIVLKCRRPEG